MIDLLGLLPCLVAAVLEFRKGLWRARAMCICGHPRRQHGPPSQGTGCNFSHHPVRRFIHACCLCRAYQALPLMQALSDHHYLASSPALHETTVYAQATQRATRLLTKVTERSVEVIVLTESQGDP